MVDGAQAATRSCQRRSPMKIWFYVDMKTYREASYSWGGRS
ncbi:hypothetical protein F383_35944 [Gossypium arboreum]|uniref:Uncharacterized protein n=1 Tax=Gossypium arboreum TaxID=29729 RepID=A0A0B0N7V8_GOSAR|nr:hypothetical protein F383_35944 [Gossypium arboreum]